MRVWMGLLAAGMLLGGTAASSAASASLEGTASARPATQLVQSSAAPSPLTSCPAGWGSLAKKRSGMSVAPIVGIRSGRHRCFDRLVIDLAGKVKGYDVRYVSSVAEDGSGRVVPLRGGAKLRIIVRAPAYDENGLPTYAAQPRTELVNTCGYRTFRQVAWAGSFEGQTTIGLGVRARLPMRAFVVDGPGAGSRLVIDVAHRW